MMTLTTYGDDDDEDDDSAVWTDLVEVDDEDVTKAVHVAVHAVVDDRRTVQQELWRAVGDEVATTQFNQASASPHASVSRVVP